jgi:ATP-dependent RNA helicase RhlE
MLDRSARAAPIMKECKLTTFSELGLNASLLKALETEGYTTPTPIQAQAIPSVLAGKDLMGIAQTGTGKTAAFALPILHRLAADRKPAPRLGARVLVLSPTRELASQIAESFRVYGRNTNLTVAVMYGGVPFRPQVNAMSRGVDILVATPGRLIDHLEHAAFVHGCRGPRLDKGRPDARHRSHRAHRKSCQDPTGRRTMLRRACRADQ